MMSAHRFVAIVGLTIALFLAVPGCTGMKDLGPAFEANKTNVDELAGNVASLNQQLRPLVVAAWDNEIESRRTVVLKELQLLGAPYKMQLDKLTGPQLDKDLVDANMDWKSDYERIGPALAAAAGDTAETDRLQSEHPVLAAIVLLKVRTADVADHAKKLRAPEGVRAVRGEITNSYPYVAQAIKAREDTLKKLDDFSGVTEKQLRLAKAHADLFDFAAKSNVNVEKAFGGVISDEGLQGQVLGLIKDERWKTSAGESLGLIKQLLDREAAAKANANKGT